LSSSALREFADDPHVGDSHAPCEAERVRVDGSTVSRSKWGKNFVIPGTQIPGTGSQDAAEEPGPSRYGSANAGIE